MKFINKLEHSKSFWFLFFISSVFFLLRLPSVIEPYWYGDEGIYEVIGQALHSGRFLYTQIWDNKPPLLYLIYAFFNGEQSNVKLLSLVVGLLSTVVFFYLSKKLLKNIKTAMIVTSSFALLFSLPLLEGNISNAENFMLLPIICAGLILYESRSMNPQAKKTHMLFSVHSSQPRLPAGRFTVFLAGLLLGIAFLFKIVAVFDLAAFLFFIVFANIPKDFDIKASLRSRPRLSNHGLWLFSLIHDSCFLILGFVIPFLITTCFFVYQHALSDFIQAIFFGNIDYVGEHNVFLIPQGLLVVKLVLLITALVVIFLNRIKLSQSELFILFWFVFSAFNAFFSQRPYTHYLFVLLPSFCLLFGMCLETLKPRRKATYYLLLASVLSLVIVNFTFFSPIKTVQYYENALLFLTNKESLSEYQYFFDPLTPRDYEVAYFINTTISKSDSIFIWGDHAQLYALTHRLPPGKFTTAYHINHNEEDIMETQEVLKKARRLSIITLSDAPSFPFTIAFSPKITLLKGATVYEENF